MTYGAMQDRIADELDRTDLTSQIQLAIRSAIKHYSSLNLWFKEERITANTIPDTEYYALPSTMIGLRSVRLEDSSNHSWVLKPKTMEYMEEHYDSASDYTGRPKEYCLFDSMLRLGPIPDETYSIRLAVTEVLDTLSATADTNEWMSAGEELIRQRAKWDIALNILKDQTQASGYKAAEIEAKDALISRSEQYTSTGKIRSRL